MIALAEAEGIAARARSTSGIPPTDPSESPTATAEADKSLKFALVDDDNIDTSAVLNSTNGLTTEPGDLTTELKRAMFCTQRCDARGSREKGKARR
jgi:hypothetical protein